MTPAQKLKLGIFLVASVALTLLVLVLFGGLTLFDRDVRYFVNVPGGVQGLEKGSAVRVRGVRVGSVTGFDIYPEGFDGVRVSFGVPRETRIHEGARALLTLQGFSGLKQLSVDPGPSSAPRLEPGETISYEESPIQRLTGNAEELGERVTQLLEEATAASRRLTTILEAVEPERVARVLERFDEGTEQLLGDARRTQRELNAVLRAARTALQQTSAGTRGLLETTRHTAEEARSAFAALERLGRRLDQLVHSSDDQLRGAAFELHDASRSLEQFAREIRQQPSRLLFSNPPPERELP
jgi:ABC-type transporter Mla subunit MlaD